ncbi:hypothetical protein LV83_02835 [Algoriphagus yeomjeoni]|uniref:Uncharacterized protein n=1 Tax=Algoriphagus yeomjeoni TaxID=291403 RepID=A0A327P6N4_9BACT|nr:hypothetical protein LV83_02835 [Algoriphagus yeomjeoni]
MIFHWTEMKLQLLIFLLIGNKDLLEQNPLKTSKIIAFNALEHPKTVQASCMGRNSSPFYIVKPLFPGKRYIFT